MAITNNPANNPTSEYRPITFVVETTIDTTTLGIVKKARARITIDGVTTAKVDVYRSPDSFSGPAAATIYVFIFDIQSVIQRRKSPKAAQITNCFGTPSAAYSAQATDCYGTFQVDFEYFYDDVTTGIRTNQGVTDSSATLDYLLATRQHGDTMSLANYIPTLASSKPFLTNAATSQNIALDESLFISTVASTGDAFKVETFDQFGGLIDSGVFSAPGSGNDQVSFGIGPNEIRVTVWDLAGSVNIDNPLVSFYEVSYGVNAVFQPYTARYTFNIVKCADGVRLHWLNRLGGTDAYTFKALNERTQTTKSDKAQKPLDWFAKIAEGNVITDKGSFKINSTAVINRTLQSQPVDVETADWLAEVLSSPEVYMETTSGLVPVVIDDTEQKLETNSSTGLMLVNFDIKAMDANEVIIQRN